MTTINSSLPVNTGSVYTKPENLPSPPEDDNSKKIVIEVKPGEDNVESGDRSGNTAQISITTPNREVEFEVSREQVFNAVERRHYKNIAGQIAGGGSSSRPLVKAAALQQAGFEREDVANMAYLNVKQDQIDTYRSATENSIYNSGSDTSGSQDSSDSSGAQLYIDAKNAYNKQQFVFSTLDRLDFSEKA